MAEGGGRRGQESSAPCSDGRGPDREALPLESLWVTVGECRIRARTSVMAVQSRFAPVVLVHGFGVSSTYFVPTAQRLSTEFSVYAPDLPGHGKSDTPRRPLVVPQLADSLVAWMDAVGLHRVSMVGNSMGCQIAVEVATRHPNRVDRLVMIGPTSDPAGRSLHQLAWRLLLSGPYERFSLLPILAVDYLRMGFRLIPEFRGMLADRIEDKLPHLSLPLMLVRGEHDAVAPHGWVAQAAGMAGADPVVVIPRGGHAVNYSAPGELVQVMIPFLRQAIATDPADDPKQA